MKMIVRHRVECPVYHQLIIKKEAKSKIWTYFRYPGDETGKILSKDIAICLICKSPVSSKEGCTSNLISHLKTHHPEKSQSFQSNCTRLAKKKDQPTTSDSTSEINGDLVFNDAIKIEIEEQTMDDEQTNSWGFMTANNDENSGVPSPAVSTPEPDPSPPPPKILRIEAAKRSSEEEVPTVLNEISDRPFKEERFEIIGKTIAMKLKGLPKQQMLLAERLINETLFQAEMGSLSMSHRITNEPRTQSMLKTHRSFVSRR